MIDSSFGRNAGMMAVVDGRSVRACPRGFGRLTAAIASSKAPKPKMPTATATVSRAMARALGYSEVRIRMNESTIASIAPSTSASWNATDRKKRRRDVSAGSPGPDTTEGDLTAGCLTFGILKEPCHSNDLRRIRTRAHQGRCQSEAPPGPFALIGLNSGNHAGFGA